MSDLPIPHTPSGIDDIISPDTSNAASGSAARHNSAPASFSLIELKMIEAALNLALEHCELEETKAAVRALIIRFYQLRKDM